MPEQIYDNEGHKTLQITRMDHIERCLQVIALEKSRIQAAQDKADKKALVAKATRNIDSLVSILDNKATGRAITATHNGNAINATVLGVRRDGAEILVNLQAGQQTREVPLDKLLSIVEG